MTAELRPRMMNGPLPIGRPGDELFIRDAPGRGGSKRSAHLYRWHDADPTAARGDFGSHAAWWGDGEMWDYHEAGTLAEWAYAACETDEGDIAPDGAWWQSCSGCTEMGDYCGNAHLYERDPVHGCYLGAGCDEGDGKGRVLMWGDE